MSEARRPRLRTALLVVALAGTIALAWRLAPASEPPPAVLLVVLDTVRADRTSIQGYERPTTPQMEAVARAGVHFEDVTAPGSWTYPSHASLFTGEPPWVHGAHLIRLPSEAERAGGRLPVGALRKDLPTLAERFREGGYRTEAVVANAWLRREVGLVRGFDRVQWHRGDAEVVERARRLIEREREQPLFLFVNLAAAHMPYRAGPSGWTAGLESARDLPAWAQPYATQEGPVGIDLQEAAEGDALDGQTRYMTGDLAIPPEGLRLLGRLYDAGVRVADYGLGRILEAWTARHPEAVVAVTSDHGEALGERRRIGHIANPYPEVLRVPLVLAAPGLLPAGERSTRPAALQELRGALLHLAGLRAEAPAMLARLDARKREAPIAAAIWPQKSWAVHVGGPFTDVWRVLRSDGWSLVWSEHERELYDLRRDPGMERNLAPRRPERAAALRRVAAAHLEPGPPVSGPPVRVRDELREQLEALGYLDE